MFPKSVSGTSGKSRENKGDDMAETSDDELRQRFFELVLSNASQNEIVWWSQNRVRMLEEQNKAMLGVVDHNKALLGVFSQKEGRIESLQSQLGDRNEAIDELEAEIKRLTGLTDQLLSNCTNLQSDEERHQRHRRERMLDEVTLICVRDGMRQMTESLTGQRYAGRVFRDAAENICHGINEHDAEQ
jgi:ElaB/YqjD/DUF883 family membrane-anchored ribosome-binding protein